MRALAIAATILALGFSSSVPAHHKPGHNPPGHAKKQQQANLSQPIAAPSLRADGWAAYVDRENGLTVDLPFGMFETIEENQRGIRLRDPQFGAALEVYTSQDNAGFDPQEFVAAIEDAERVREVTYRAAGQNWFVLSGFYSRREAGDAVIFYTKFMFSPDRSRLAAFEISFPAGEKPRFADVVERIENSFSGPRRR